MSFLPLDWSHWLLASRLAVTQLEKKKVVLRYNERSFLDLFLVVVFSKCTSALIGSQTCPGARPYSLHNKLSRRGKKDLLE
jgi:hypothetical protein